ncbi:SDR family oxidoreductase [Phreatobacter sp. AB_2022a]|uniref:SDR family oxidoreductase n=1 Tax=Phreatobacter sp. AB_2022a TaxID=3003134 RepID=UPI002287583C|nr:SDR family oxidoreductase [Phreatobacter sp. AB_2022a]MCZ0738508.1 SDR family oxidoreductase [Phreatobacter sp. AB_2022a]
MARLTGKVALVTGGSRGIGAAIAKRLAADGADVALTYTNSPAKADAVVAEIGALGRKGLALAADSADAAAVTGAVERTVEAFGRIDILVNNAGIFVGGSLDNDTLEDIDRTLAVNVRAVYVGSQAAARHMGKGGRIISIGSCLAELVGDPGMTLYSMSKAALIGMTKGMARDLGARGITVNIVHPGPTDTDMNPAEGAHADKQRAKLAVGHYGEAADIAAAVAYLAGAEAGFVTGASLAVDGGFAA